MNASHVLATLLTGLLLGQQALAAGQNDHRHPPQAGEGHHSSATAAGQPGQLDQVSRTIEVQADDRMRFTFSDTAPIRVGETIRFVVTNNGQLPHEFVIATAGEHRAHGQMMAAMASGAAMSHHSMPNALSLAPGEQKTLIWRFSQGDAIEAACNLPGHYQAGMHQALPVH